MGVIWNGGKLLFSGNQLAFSTACCCDGNCCGRKLPGGPTPVHMPEVLHVEIENINNCPCSEGASFDLTWSALNQYWEEFTDLGLAGCGLVNDPSHWILQCGPTVEQFTLGYLGICEGIHGHPIQGTCNPLFLLFEFEIGGIGCCDNDPLSPAATIRIRITE